VPDGLDDWYVLGNARTDASYPDDWYVPPSAAPNLGQTAPSLQPNTAKAGLSNPPAAPVANRPAAPPIPFANYWSLIPASRVGAMAWDPPNLPLFSSSPTNNFPAQTPPPAPPILPGSRPPTLGIDSPPWSSTPSLLSPATPEGGLLGKLATLGTSPSPWSAGGGGLLDALATLGTSPPTTPPWPQGGLLGGLSRLAPSSPGPSGSFPSPPPPQSAGAQAVSPVGRRPIGDYSTGEIAGDAAKSLGVGTGQGVIHLAGLFGDAREMLANGTQRAVDYFAPGYVPDAGNTLSKALASTFPALAGPTSSQLQNAVESYTGPFYQPKTIVGDYAKTAGEFLPASLLVPGGGLASNALRYGLLPALSSETAGQLTKGTAAEPWARTLAAILAAAAPSALRQLQQTRSAPGVSETSPTSSEAGGPTAQPPPSDVGLNGTSNGRGVWDLPATKRGRILESIFGHNLHPNHPTIDIWDPNTGVVTSLKSVDLEAPGYQVEGDYERALYNKLSNSIDDLAEFKGGRYAGTDVPENEITSRTLTVIIPSLGTAEQRQVLRQIFEVGKQRGVLVRTEVYR
jgi:hypothetical protein